MDAVAGTPSVKAVPAHGGTVIRFSGRHGRRLFARLAGRRIDVVCEQGPSQDPGSDFVEDSVEFRAPRKGSQLRVGRPAHTADWCEVLVQHRSIPNSPVVAVALTPAGKVFLDERLRASLVSAIIDVADFDSAGHFPPTSEVVAKLHGLAIGLANPGDPVPAGRYGFYSDGAKHAEAVATTPAGRRLFMDVNGDTLSTNILPHLTSLQAGIFDPSP